MRHLIFSLIRFVYPACVCVKIGKTYVLQQRGCDEQKITLWTVVSAFITEDRIHIHNNNNNNIHAAAVAWALNV